MDGHATNAAIRAGFSAKNAANIASKLLKKSQVADALSAKSSRIEELSELSAARVLKEIQRVAYVDPGVFFDAEGYVLPLEKMPEDARRAIAGIDVDEIWGKADDGEGNTGRACIGRTKKLKLASKLDALKLLGQHLRLFTELHQHTVQVDLLTLLAGEGPEPTPKEQT